VLVQPEGAWRDILDADREGFLRSETSLIQTFGRASRNINGRVILYAQTMTGSLQRAIGEANRRRRHQVRYNRLHHITPAPIAKGVKDFYDDDYWIKKSDEDSTAQFNDRESLENEIHQLTSKMKEKAAALDFKGAATIRDRIKQLKNLMLEMF